MTFHLMFVYYIFSSVWVAEWPLFGKELPIRLAVCSHCVLYICIFFDFESGVWFFMLQFLVIAYLLLLKSKRKKMYQTVQFAEGIK